ncbi:histidine--tRNA ligase, partial [archaeon]|nr:histidine--tRNA ligase [archaeon]
EAQDNSIDFNIVKNICNLKGNAQILGQISRLCKNKKSKEGLEELKELNGLLESVGKGAFVEIDLSIARGLDYYTGTVFECFNREETLRAIIGGGRYDTMVEQLVGEAAPATGFGFGFSTLELLLKEKNKVKEWNQDWDNFVGMISENERDYANTVCQKLRDKGYCVEIELLSKKLRNQLNYANTIKAKSAVIIGEEEKKQKTVTVKDLSTGKQTTVRLRDL